MSGTRPRTNRLRRSVRPSQAAERSPSAGDEPGQTPRTHEHQTPVRSRLSADSPQNESFNADLHQDIVWDTTSPSPHRLGKRGRRVGPVTISDIVNRIAPESGRPRILEPTLQQWIGDSATIPCTPELQAPKAKKKSPRPRGVDDLLRLAKQFDFNMLHETHEYQDPDSDPTQNPAQNTVHPPDPIQNPAPDWASDEDLDLLFDGSTQDVSGVFSQDFLIPNVTQNCHSSLLNDFQSKSTVSPSDTKHVLRKSQQSSSNLEKEPFSPRHEPNPTKKLSQNFTKMSNHCTPKSEKQHSNKIFKFKSLTNSKSDEISPQNVRLVQNCDFDDWGDDDLMEDSLLMEMTQNPFGFSSPKSTSTQRNYGKTDGPRQTFALNHNFSKTSEKTLSDCNVGKTESTGKFQWKNSNVIYLKSNNSTMQQNVTSKTLQENSDLNISSKWTDAKQPAGFSTSQNDCSSKHSQNLSKNSAQVCQNNMKSFNTSESTSAAKRSDSETSHSSENMWRWTGPTAERSPRQGPTDFSKTSHGFHSNSTIKSNSNSVLKNGQDMRETERTPSNPGGGFVDDDLDSIFSSDPIWDSPKDDDLLCELCEVVESQIQNAANQSQRAGQTADQTERFGQESDQMQEVGQWVSQVNSTRLGTNQVPGFGSTTNQMLRRAHGGTQEALVDQMSSQIPQIRRGANQKQRAGQWTNQTQRTGPEANQMWSRSGVLQQTQNFTFKRPAPLPLCGPPGATKCSAAEIELKKQQALERRRQRLQASSNRPISS